jgi:Cu(I)/Ag(I) efflux system membrane fusion protein
MDHAHGAHGPEGYAAVHLDADQAKVLGLSTTTIEERDFTKTAHTVGVVALDETRSAHVHPKVRGWIDGIRVSFVGQTVRSGDVLCSVYSQEVYSAEL